MQQVTTATSHTFQSALLVWQPDFERQEHVNVGAVLISKQTKFCKVRIVERNYFDVFKNVFSWIDPELDFLYERLQEYVEVADKAEEVGRDRPLRFDHAHVFYALFGRPNEATSLFWRTARSGLLMEHSPQQELDELFEKLVARPKVGRGALVEPLK